MGKRPASRVGERPALSPTEGRPTTGGEKNPMPAQSSAISARVVSMWTATLMSHSGVDRTIAGQVRDPKSSFLPQIVKAADSTFRT